MIAFTVGCRRLAAKIVDFHIAEKLKRIWRFIYSFTYPANRRERSAYSFRLNRCHTTTSRLMCTMFQISFQLRLRTAITLSLLPLIFALSLSLSLLRAQFLRAFFSLFSLLFFCTQWRMWWQFAPASHRFISPRSFLSLYSHFPIFPLHRLHRIRFIYAKGCATFPSTCTIWCRVLCRFSF